MYLLVTSVSVIGRKKYEDWEEKKAENMKEKGGKTKDGGKIEFIRANQMQEGTKIKSKRAHEN